MAAKKTPKAAFVEHAWKIVLQQLDRGRQRSGKALARQSEVRFLPIEENHIRARIISKGFDGGLHFVELPCVDNWNAEIDNLASWFSHRLDLYAACLSGEWNHEFLDLIDKAGLRLFPDDLYAKQLQWDTKCTCNSQEPLCKHVVGVIYKLIWEMESKPIRAIEFVCVDPEALIDKIHILASLHHKDSRYTQGAWELNSGKSASFFTKKMLDFERMAYEEREISKDNLRTRQMAPDIQIEDLKAKRDIYMI